MLNTLDEKLIRKFSKLLKQRLDEVVIPEDAKKISIIELDEIFSYCQKQLEKSRYGLLLIGGRNAVVDLEVMSSLEIFQAI